MAYINEKTYHVTTQPVSGNPFEELDGEWTVNLWNCCDDVSQCCYAYWCWCCFLGSLAGKINESKCSCWCLPNALSTYRMKVRSVLKIKGDSCSDYFVTTCCPFCAGIQMINELAVRGVGKRNIIYQTNTTSY